MDRSSIHSPGMRLFNSYRQKGCKVQCEPSNYKKISFVWELFCILKIHASSKSDLAATCPAFPFFPSTLHPSLHFCFHSQKLFKYLNPSKIICCSLLWHIANILIILDIAIHTIIASDKINDNHCSFVF